MARISSEDCLKHLDSPFALVHAAVRRARQLQLGSKPLVERPGEKLTVTALREIAAGLVEEVPLSGTDQEELRPASVTEDEEFDLALESPDLNVQLDLDPDEIEEPSSLKKSAKKDSEEDALEEFEDDDDSDD